MYNTRNSRGSNRSNPYMRKVETFRQQQQKEEQQQLTMPHVATFVTSKSTGLPQIQQPNCQQSIQNSSLQKLPTQLSCSPNIQTPTSMSAPDLQSQEVKSFIQDIQSINVKVEDIQSIDESKEDKVETKWPVKRKINKKEQKKRLNARMRRLVCPKSPLMVFSELYKNVPIKLEEQLNDNYPVFIASIEIDGQVYTGDHISKTQAKQKACENFLRVVLAKKMSEQSRQVKKEESFTEIKMDNNEHNTPEKPKGPPQEDFPWPHFASLAMHNLIAHWELQPVAKVIQEETKVKVAPKTSGMKKFPSNPENYNPVQLLHQMMPGIKFSEQDIEYVSGPQLFKVNCEIKDVQFSGNGTTKKAAKKECAIAAIKYFWNFDFHAIVNK